VITPSFFKSAACRSELERFLKREETLGRKDLILPVYYVECPVLSVEAKRKEDPLAMAVAERQYVDWRELRFEPFTSPEVGKRIAGIARQIVEAMERGALPAPPLEMTATANDGREVQSEWAQPQETTGGLVAAVSQGPQPKTEILTSVVDAMGRGDFLTLSEALKAAKPGTRILVRPGLYQEGVVINKPVEIVGDGDRAEIVVEAARKNVVLFRSSMGRITNLTLRQTGGGDWFGIDITQGRLDLDECDISSQGFACVAIRAGTDPRLIRNRIHNGAKAGTVIFGNGRGTLENNEFSNSGGFNIVLGGESNPILRHNRICGGNRGGVFFLDSCFGTLEDNEIFGNMDVGVLITDGGKPTLRRNHICNNGGHGIAVKRGGGGIFENNDLRENAMGPWDIDKLTLPNIRREGNLE